jgi:hypothetical protein
MCRTAQGTNSPRATAGVEGGSSNRAFDARIETDAERIALAALEVQLAHGYLFGRAAPPTRSPPRATDPATPSYG